MINIPPRILILILIAAFALGALLFTILIRWIRKLIIRKRMKKGRKGESAAKKYLLKQGFTIIDEQCSKKSHIIVDKKPYTYEVRGDFIVEKNGVRALVEVKTGQTAINPLHTQTRRQLLEYCFIFGLEKMYLFNGNDKTMKEIEFPRVIVAQSKR